MSLKIIALLLLVFSQAERAAHAQNPPLAKIEIGAIVGAQYIPASGRFFLYAEPVPGSLSAELWRDEVVQVAKASLAVGQSYGFSLDFARRGTQKFKPDDIYDFKEIAERLSEADVANPILTTLRARLGSLRIPSSAKPSKDEIRQLTDAFNRLLADPTLVPTLCIEDSNPDIAPLLKDGCDSRRARLIIEDFVGRGLRRDIEHRYVITYKPLMDNDDLQRVFSSTRAEAVLLSGDAWLKTLAGEGGQFPVGLAFGPSEVNLCAEEAMTASQRGSDIPNGEHAEYFSLDLDYAPAPPALPGKVIWFTNQRLVVSTDRGEGSQPDCSDRFATLLNKSLPRIVNYDGKLGSDLRNLRALLELSRSVNYFIELAPIDKEYLPTVPTERIRNVPPPVVDMPIRFAASGRALGYRSFGGVMLARGPFCGIPTVGKTQTAENDLGDRKLTEPGFAVKTVEVGGSRLLRIDISSILMKTVNLGNKTVEETTLPNQDP